MALFPQQFIDDLKQHADIVVVIQDYVSLKKTGATYKGSARSTVRRRHRSMSIATRGFSTVSGAGRAATSSSSELRESVGFPDAVRMLAQRFGMTLPELEQSDEQRASAAERESLLKVHDAAASWFRQQLASTSGARIRAQIDARAVAEATSDALGLGFAPRDGLGGARAAGILAVTADTRRPCRPA